MQNLILLLTFWNLYTYICIFYVYTHTYIYLNLCKFCVLIFNVCYVSVQPVYGGAWGWKIPLVWRVLDLPCVTDSRRSSMRYVGCINYYIYNFIFYKIASWIPSSFSQSASLSPLPSPKRRGSTVAPGPSPLHDEDMTTRGLLRGIMQMGECKLSAKVSGMNW